MPSCLLSISRLFLSPSDFISMSVRAMCSGTHILCVDITLLRNLRKMCFLYYQVVCAAGVNADQSNPQDRKPLVSWWVTDLQIPVAPLDHV